MPVVPRYTPQVQAAPIPGARIQPQDIGDAGEFAKTAAAAGGLVREHERIKGDFDMLAVQEADNKLYALETRLLHDPKTGALTKRGKNALGSRQDVGDVWDKEAAEIQKELVGPEQQQAFARLRDQRRRGMDRTLDIHAGNELRRFEEETSAASIVNAENEAVANYGDPERLASALSRQRAAIFLHAQRNGFSDQATKAHLAETEGRTHAAVVGAMLSDGAYGTAKTYFETNRDAFGNERKRVQAAIEEGLRRETAMKVASDTMRNRFQELTGADLEEYEKATGKPLVATAAESEKEALERVRDDPRLKGDPRALEMAEDRVRTLWRDRLRSERQEQDDAFENAAAVLEETGSLEGVEPDVLVNKLRPAQRAALHQRARQLARSVEQQSDWRAWTMFQTIERKDLAKMNLAELIEGYRTKLSEDDWRAVLKTWKDAREAEADPKKAAAWASSMSDRELVLRGARSGAFGIGEADTLEAIGRDKEKAQTFRRLTEAVDDATLAWFHKTGKNPTDEEKRKIIDQTVLRLSKTFRVKRTTWGIDWLAGDEQLTLAQMSPEDVKAAYIPVAEIPKRDLDEIVIYIQSVGRKVTDDKIKRMWAAREMGQRSAFKAIAEED